MSPISYDRSKAWAWALYDSANSAFAVTVLSGFFPVFFKSYWSSDIEATTSTLYLGAANSLGALVVALLAPIIGAIADIAQTKRRFLLMFTVLGVVCTSLLYTVDKGQAVSAISLFVLAGIGFGGAIVINDAQLTDVSPKNRMHQISALGYGLGYLGGGVLFAAQVFFVSQAENLGLDKALAVRWTFVSVGLWWALLALPVLIKVPDPVQLKPLPYIEAVRKGTSQLLTTLRQIRQLPTLMLFLLAYWIYIDGVGTVIRMAVDYGMAIGLNSDGLVQALLITQFVAFPSALAFGWIGKRWGAKPGILLGLVLYTLTTLGGYSMTSVTHFLYLAACVGLVQGGVQSLSRSLYGQLIPRNRSAEFFGFYNLFGKFAAILGPLFVGALGYLFANPRVSILGVLPFFIIGGWLLTRVRLDRANAELCAFEHKYENRC